MKKKLILLLIILVSSILKIYAQTVTLSGFISDSNSNETIIGAVINNGSQGTVSNNFGRYTLKLKIGVNNLVIKSVGYKTNYVGINCQNDTVINIYLQKNQIREVIIKGKKDVVHREYTSMTSIPMQQLKAIPSVGGEADIMKAIQHTPGITGGVEGSAGVYVRGGSPDQNLILLDDVPVYNINHLFGYVSVFSPEAVKNFDVYKAGFPARYGGRLSSVMDVRLKEGNMKNLNGAVTISPIASSILLEGPLIKNKASFLISARRTWLDVIAYPVSKIALKKAGVKSGSLGLNFYDLTAKANYKLNENNRLYFSFYGGKDKFSTKIDNETTTDTSEYRYKSNQFLQWGNLTSSLRYNKIFNQKLFGNATLAYTQYQFETGNSADITKVIRNPYEEENTKASLKYSSSIQDVIFKYDLEYAPNNWNQIRAGVNQSYKTFKPGVYVSASSDAGISLDTTVNNNQKTNNQTDFYIEDNFKPTSFLNINAGLRYEMFNTKNYSNKSFQPRLNVSAYITKTLSLKGSYAAMSQNIHLLANSGTGLPTDLWLPATNLAPTEKSQQYVFGIYKNVKGMFDVSVEGYYKKMKNLIEYKEGASFIGTFTGWEEKIESGNGDVKGIEFFLHKKEGRLNGWIGYSLSYNNRAFANINNGVIFPYRYDRRHVFDIFANYEVYKTEEKERTISATWQYSTGNSITLPTQIYMGAPNEPSWQYNTFSNIIEGLEGNSTDIQGLLTAPSRNNYRMRAQHRLDFAYSTTKKKDWGERTWNFTIYNMYARRNPYYIYVRKKNGNSFESYQEKSLFSIFPSISYSIKFDAKKMFTKQGRKERAERFY